MLSNLLKINFKDKPISTSLKGNMFVDPETHKNKMINSDGIDYLNIKMDVTKTKPDNAEVTGSSFDQLKPINSFERKFEKNPYGFMGLDIDIPNTKIPAPYQWRVPNDKELIISRMQNEAGVPNDYSNKLNNYLTNGAINGNFESGREAGFANMMSKLNIKHNDFKTAYDLEKFQPSLEEQKEGETSKFPIKEKLTRFDRENRPFDKDLNDERLSHHKDSRGESGKPLRVQPVQPDEYALERRPRTKTKAQLREVERPQREFLGYPKDEEGQKAGLKGSLISLSKKTVQMKKPLKLKKELKRLKNN
jgi:hypothetical protein